MAFWCASLVDQQASRSSPWGDENDLGALRFTSLCTASTNSTLRIYPSERCNDDDDGNDDDDDGNDDDDDDDDDDTSPLFPRWPLEMMTSSMIASRTATSRTTSGNTIDVVSSLSVVVVIAPK